MDEDLRRDDGEELYQGMTAAEFDAQRDWSTDIHRSDWRDPSGYEPDASEVFQEDGREIVELDQATRRVERQTRGASSLGDLVQDFVQAVKDFIQGREREEPTQEHGTER